MVSSMVGSSWLKKPKFSARSAAVLDQSRGVAALTPSPHPSRAAGSFLQDFRTPSAPETLQGSGPAGLGGPAQIYERPLPLSLSRLTNLGHRSATDITANISSSSPKESS